jgi:hypothetical protein
MKWFVFLLFSFMVPEGAMATGYEPLQENSSLRGILTLEDGRSFMVELNALEGSTLSKPDSNLDYSESAGQEERMAVFLNVVLSKSLKWKCTTPRVFLVM